MSERQILLSGFGSAGQRALRHAHVLVIGAGGLGCPALQTMVATGIGTITLIDDDVVASSNLHRQILFTPEDVGQLKVDAAARRLTAMQPELTIHTIEGRVHRRNAIELFAGVDVVVDGSDTFATKYLAADAAEITGTPLVWGTVLRYGGQPAVWRSGAGERGVGLRDLYPNAPDPADAPDCATAGVLGVTTSVMGSLMATETVKYIAGLEPASQQVGRLLTYDALSSTMTSFTVAADPARPLVTDLPEPAGAATLRTALTEGWQLLDVREPEEKATRDLPTQTPTLHYPASRWDKDSPPAGLDGTVLVYCASGQRSARFIDRFGPRATAAGVRLVNLPGGTTAHGVAR
ncbi:ThiF family adenylyltransferase [Corynebacterium sp.]|uniref:ThiF family adenylyltransferase n=1 Tax=Corynebacterium sp. TaxID=1720 RepID=UPI003735561A